MFDNIKVWITDIKVWATAAVALAAEWVFGLLDLIRGFVS